MRGSVHRKGKAYYVVFRLYDSASGKKQQKWIPAGLTRREAERKLSELMAEVHEGSYRELKKATFKEFAELWLASYAKTKLKPSTLASYESIINTCLIPTLGDSMLTDIGPMTLQRYVAKRLDAAKPKTVVNELVLIKVLFKHAVRWGYLKSNPALLVERPRVEKEEMAILTPEDINAFLEKANAGYRVFFLTAILTGMRRGELLALKWGDIDWNHRQIHVRRSLWRGRFITPKSKASIRKVDMSPYLASELRKHKLRATPSELDLVFPNAQGRPMDPDDMVKRQFFPALRRAKIRQIRFHDLRHTNVALRIEQGQNLKYIQRQLGHASIQTTLDRYGHLIREVNEDAARRLDDILGLSAKGEEIKSKMDKSVRRLLEDLPDHQTTLPLTY